MPLCCLTHNAHRIPVKFTAQMHQDGCTHYSVVKGALTVLGEHKFIDVECSGHSGACNASTHMAAIHHSLLIHHRDERQRVSLYCMSMLPTAQVGDTWISLLLRATLQALSHSFVEHTRQLRLISTPRHRGFPLVEPTVPYGALVAAVPPAERWGRSTSSRAA